MTTKQLSEKLGHGWFKPKDFMSLPPGDYIIFVPDDGSDTEIISVEDIVEAENQGDGLYLKEKLQFEDPKDEEMAEEEDKYREYRLDKWQARGALTIKIEPQNIPLINPAIPNSTWQEKVYYSLKFLGSGTIKDIERLIIGTYPGIPHSKVYGNVPGSCIALKKKGDIVEIKRNKRTNEITYALKPQ